MKGISGVLTSRHLGSATQYIHLINENSLKFSGILLYSKKNRKTILILENHKNSQKLFYLDFAWLP